MKVLKKGRPQKGGKGMKILKPPPEPTWEMKHVCATCKAELLVEYSDIWVTRGYEGDWYFRARCPCCKNGIPIPLNEINSMTAHHVNSIPEKEPEPATT